MESLKGVIMKRLIVGQPLHTKDELVFSNASVIGVGNRGKSVTYQIRSVYGNIGILTEEEVEQWFNLQPLNEEATEPTVNTTADGFSLTVAAAHAVNIKEFLPGDMYAYEDEGSRGKFIVGRNYWSRFSELLCL